LKQRLAFLSPRLVILSGVLVLISLGGLGQTMKAALTLLLVLFVPGFILTAVLFRGRALGTPLRLLLSIGLSLPLAGLTVLVINRLPQQVHAMPLLGGLILSLLSLLAVAILAVYSHSRPEFSGLNLPSFSPYQLGLLGLAALITFLALSLARTPTAPAGLTGYTLLWVQPATTPGRVWLGVRSEEFTPVSYRLELGTGDAANAGSTVELQLKLQPGETWEYPFELPSDLPEEKPVTVRLYRLDNPDQVYRHVVWWPGNNTSRTTTQ
jgi:hypothetical protein